jgi:hypothetical protein
VTGVKKKELNPRWTEGNLFTLAVPLNEKGEPSAELHIQVMEYDYSGDDFLGETSVDWTKMISIDNDSPEIQKLHWEGDLGDPDGNVNKKGVQARKKMLENGVKTGGFAPDYKDAGYGKIKLELQVLSESGNEHTCTHDNRVRLPLLLAPRPAPARYRLHRASFNCAPAAMLARLRLSIRPFILGGTAADQRLNIQPRTAPHTQSRKTASIHRP